MQIADDEIIRVMTEVAQRFLIPKFLELGMNSTGEWVKSIEVSASNNVGYIRGRDYSYYLVNGRKPGKRPPIAPLERWAQAKLGLSGQQAKSAAFAIANKIAKEGTEYYQRGGTDLLEVLESPECLDYVRNELKQILTEDLKAQILIEAEKLSA
ncbi:MAG TPA: hypothetical protein VFM82_03545 [Flavobacteriaceae bacterium]|nr:hypothetical protein [Flavobacteriaceae bacterium]